MDRNEIIEKLKEEFNKVNSPLSVKNLTRRLNLSRRCIQYILINNPDTFVRAEPIEVGSGKWCPIKELEANTKGKSRRLRKLINIWKLK